MELFPRAHKEGALMKLGQYTLATSLKGNQGSKPQLM
jgi:hypothetical protein